METLTIDIGAGETKPFEMGGQYIEVLAAGGLLDIILYGDTGAVETARGSEAGSWMKESFRRFTLKSAIAQQVRLLITGREGGSRRTSGSVTVTNVNGAFTQSSPVVTNASGVLLAANAARRYLLIQNRDVSALLYVNLQGAAATVAGGFEIEPGGSYELNGFAPSNQITAISNEATADVVVVQG